MKTSDIFNVQTNIVLAFDSRNKHYTMKLLIENGLIILSDDKGKEEIFFLGDHESYTGETPSENESIIKEVEEKPKKKRRSKKKK